MMTCVVGTSHVLDLAVQHGARMVFTSTSEVYGDPSESPQSEEYRGNVNCTGPRACYDEGKRAAEALIFDYIRIHGVDACVLRVFNTYGPGMHIYDGRVVSNFVWRALYNKPLTIYGNGKQDRSFCYVDDTVNGIILAMEHRQHLTGPINIGNPNENVTIGDIAELIIATVGHDVSITYDTAVADDPMRRRPDISKATSLLKWTPVTYVGSIVPCFSSPVLFGLSSYVFEPLLLFF